MKLYSNIVLIESLNVAPALVFRRSPPPPPAPEQSRLVLALCTRWAYMISKRMSLDEFKGTARPEINFQRRPARINCGAHRAPLKQFWFVPPPPAPHPPQNLKPQKALKSQPKKGGSRKKGKGSPNLVKLYKQNVPTPETPKPCSLQNPKV